MPMKGKNLFEKTVYRFPGKAQRWVKVVYFDCECPNHATSTPLERGVGASAVLLFALFIFRVLNARMQHVEISLEEAFLYF